MKYYGLSVLLGSASYGILSTIVVKAYGQGYSLGEVIGTQLILGSVLCWLWVYLRNSMRARELMGDPVRLADDKAARALTWKQRGTLLACGIPSMMTNLLYNDALQHVPASLAIVLLFQFTWIGVLIESAMKRRRPSSVIYLTLAVLLGGTLLAVGLFEKGIGAVSAWGIVLGLLSAVSYSFFILVSGKAVVTAPPASKTAWMTTGSMIGVLLVHPPTFLFNGHVTGELILFGAVLGLFGSFIPPILYAIGVPRVGNGLAGILGSAELPVAVSLSAFILHEQISPVQWGGVALVLFGVAIPELGKRIRPVRARMSASFKG